MPFSPVSNFPGIFHFISAIRPTRILEIGIGMGAYGLLLRQVLDISYERLAKSDWQLKLDGVEIFEPYRNPVWDYVYDRILMGDIRTMHFEKNSYDLALCIDVLEHLTVTDASSVVTHLLDTAGTVIATSPRGAFPQGAWGGNEAERHLSVVESKNLPNVVVLKTLGVCNCFVCSRNPQMIQRIQEASDYCPVCRPEYIPLLSIKTRKAFLRLQRFAPER